MIDVVINSYNMHCFIYVRVSTDRQAEKGLSIPAQLEACRQFAVQRNWLVSEEFIEAGTSAKTTDRPALQQLLTKCRRNELASGGVLLVHKIDRLARNIADHVAICATLQQRQIRLTSVSENLEDSASGQLVEHIMAAIAEFYSMNLADEVRKGMRQKVLRGGWPHHAPRGYRAVYDAARRSSLEIHPIDGPLIRRAFEQFSTSRFSLRMIASELAAVGVRSARGRPLSRHHVHTILTNPFYHGRIVWKDLSVAGQHPPLVSDDLFSRVQEAMRCRTQSARTHRVAGFPLRGLARCAQCLGGMTAERTKGKYGYYRCCRQQYQPALCRARYCRADTLHDQLDDLCRDLLIENIGDSDLMLPVSDPRKAMALRMIFESITIAREGILDFALRT